MYRTIFHYVDLQARVLDYIHYVDIQARALDYISLCGHTSTCTGLYFIMWTYKHMYWTIFHYVDIQARVLDYISLCGHTSKCTEYLAVYTSYSVLST